MSQYEKLLSTVCVVVLLVGLVFMASLAGIMLKAQFSLIDEVNKFNNSIQVHDTGNAFISVDSHGNIIDVEVYENE